VSNLIQQGDQFIKSDAPADDGYGRNGFTGPSSDLPGKKTTSGFLPKAGAPINSQTRTVLADPIPTMYGHKPSTPNPVKVPASTNRRR
jgi:hypothetical protein